MGIILKKIEESDIGKIIKWKSDPDLSKQIMSRFQIISKEEGLNWLQKNSYDTHQRLNGIYYKVNNKQELLGITRLMFIDFEAQNAEFGIYIGDKNYQGKGIGKKALKLTLEQGFLELGLHKIYLKVNSKNEKAINLYKKFNFQIEGVLKDHYFVDGNFVNLVYMSLFKTMYR